MNMELFSDGMVVSLLGMGIVFAFLAILVCTMYLMGIIMKYLNTWFPEEVVEVVALKRQKATDDDSAIALAIAAVMARQGR